MHIGVRERLHGGEHLGYFSSHQIEEMEHNLELTYMLDQRKLWTNDQDRTNMTFKIMTDMQTFIINCMG